MIIVLIAFLILLAIGMPVGFSIGISGVFYFLQHAELPMATIGQLPISQTQSVTLLAVPLFIFAGSLMNSSGITDRLIKLAMLLAGHMRGGMAQVSVILSTLMGGCSGSSNADAAMEARILGPEMLKQGYPRGYAAVVIGFTSLITSTIPPGVGMILYGTVGEVSIGRLFSAGIMSGLIMMVAFMITVAITARRRFPRARETRAPFKEILLSLKDTIWALIFPIVLIGSLRLGLFTPSEVGAFACCYALIVGFFVYKEMTIKSLIATLKEAIRDIGAIMFMISMCGIFAYGIPMNQIPQKLTMLITSHTSSKAVVVAIIFFLYIIFGMFMDGSIVILLLTPILMPIIKSVGLDPVLFGVVTSIIVNDGYPHPASRNRHVHRQWHPRSPHEGVSQGVDTLLHRLIGVGALLLAIPNIILFLPNLLYGVA